MENATKALLIAAAVLIVILLIAFGMKIFNSTSDVSGQAQTTGQGISEQTGQASSSAISSISAANASFSNEPISKVKNKIDSSGYTGNNKSKTEVEETVNYIESIEKENTAKDVRVYISYYNTKTGSSSMFGTSYNQVLAVLNNLEEENYSIVTEIFVNPNTNTASDLIIVYIKY